MKQTTGLVLTAVLSWLSLIGGCSSGIGDRDRFQVKVRFVGDPHSARAVYVKIDLGNNVINSDEYPSFVLMAGQEKSVNLFSERTVTNGLVLYYHYADLEKQIEEPIRNVWQSEWFPPHADYRIVLSIDDAGKVTQTSCRLPC